MSNGLYSDLLATQLVAQSDYNYDLVGRLTQLTHRKGTATFANYNWSFDAANRIVGFSSPDGNSSYSYDSGNQLTATDHNYQGDEAYSYDDNGNRVGVPYQVQTNNQLQSDGVYNYEYDGEGNRIKQIEIATLKVTEYVWDYRNRLTGVITKDSNGNVVKSVEYTYDVFNRRIAKEIDSDGNGPVVSLVEGLVYDGEHILLSFDGEGNQTHRYLHGPFIDAILADSRGDNQVNWALGDNQRTVRDVINSQGVLENHISYDSFGNVTGETNSSLGFRFGYTGREVDSETGLYFYRARYYDGLNGRFISEDPIGFDGGDGNLYRYVGNSPVNYVDPMGEQDLNILLQEMYRQKIEQELLKTPITTLHERIIQKAMQTQPIKGTNEWDSGDFLQWQAGLLDINTFKNQWVCGYKSVINAAANEFNIPPSLLAAVAWREVGGDPHFVDSGAYDARALGLYAGLPSETSFGNLSVQVRTAAGSLEYNLNQLGEGEMLHIIKSLQEPRQNLFIAAKYLSDLRDIYIPGKGASSITERELLALAGAYNAGAIYPTLEGFWQRNKNGGNYAGGYGRSAFNGLQQCGCF